MAQENDPRTNARPLDDKIAGTGRGIPNDALAAGEELPTPPSEDQIAEIARKLDVPAPDSRDPT